MIGGHIIPPADTHRSPSHCMSSPAAYYKELSCCRETARYFVSLNINSPKKRSLEMKPSSRATSKRASRCFIPFVNRPTYVGQSRTVSEIFSVKQWRDLEIWVRSRTLAVIENGTVRFPIHNLLKLWPDLVSFLRY